MKAAISVSSSIERNALDALTKHICVLDRNGTILAVNRAWREFAQANHGVPERVLEGCNYLAICDIAVVDNCTDAATFADGARAVLQGRQKQFFKEYTCHSPDEKRWFQVRVTRFDGDGETCAVVTHENITERKRSEESLRRFRFAMDATVDGIYLIDPVALRFIDINHTAGAMVGYTREELLAERPGHTAGISEQEMRQVFEALIASGQIQTLFQAHRHKNGSIITTETIRRPVHTENGWIVVTTMRDMTAHLQAEAAARRHTLQQSLIAAFGQQALTGMDLETLCRQAMATVREGLDADFCHLLQTMPDTHTLAIKVASGWEPAWLDWSTSCGDQACDHDHLLRSEEPLIVDDFSTEPRFAPSTILREHGVTSAAEVLITGTSGRYGILGAFSRTPRRFSAHDITFLQSIANIIESTIERQRSEEKLAYISQFDPLTHLPNRALLRDRLGQVLTQGQRNGWKVGVIVVDLDRFKSVNDTLGNDAGDEVLQQMARRLAECVRTGDSVSRPSDDQFAVVLSSLAQSDDAGRVAEKIMEACRRPFDIESGPAYVTASIGIAVAPADGNDADSLLRNAAIAVHRAKEQGRDNIQFYLPTMNDRAVQRMQTEAALRGALARGEFLLHYQPKADLYTGRICGFEALLRWQHPSRGLVPPGEFISVLEDTGLIVSVGEWVIRSVCEQLRLWQDQGLKALPVAVNLSARQFQQHDLDASIALILQETGIDARLLELELTESLLMIDAEQAVQTLRKLKSYGVQLAVDDFGTGYSSLAYLKRFPLDALKIDRAFIRDCIVDAEDAMIASAVISLAHSLKLKVVAEGVETEAQLNFLRARGCDQMQGYFFARPLDIAAATEALATNKQLEGSTFEDPMHRTTLLLVDDNPDDLELSQLNLTSDGYHILTAHSGQVALNMLARHKVDVVISDQNMPSMSGADFLTAVRKLYPDIVRIILSASDDPDILPKVVNEAGIHTFLSKHWESERLRLAVRDARRGQLNAIT